MKYFTFFIISIISLYSCSKWHGKTKAIWIKNAFQSLNTDQYPRIKAIAWWHENFDKTKLRIDSSSESLEAYQKGVSSIKYVSQLSFINDKLVIPENTKMYHGALPSFGGTEDVVSVEEIEAFETFAEKDIAWVYFSNNWFSQIRFPSSRVEIIKNTGKTPFIRMMPRTDYNQVGADENYSMKKIVSGELDADLIQWAIDAKNTDFPLLVEFGTEVNGDWFSWNGKYNGAGNKEAYGDSTLADGPEIFRDAFRHILDICNDNGADNITWFFHINYNNSPNVEWNKIENYYPGDDYIDWLGISVYGPQKKTETYIEFSDALDILYPALSNLSSKPIAILEFGITEY